MMKRRNLLIAIAAVSGGVAVAAAEAPSGRTWPDKADGFASVNALGQNGTTGGVGGKTVTVTTRAELEKYTVKKEPYIIRVQGSIDMSVGQRQWVSPVNVASDKTIIGVGKDAELVKGGLSISSFAEPGGGSRAIARLWVRWHNWRPVFSV